MLDLKALCRDIQQRTDSGRFTRMSHRLTSEHVEKYCIQMEADAFVASVCVWGNGDCDFDFMDLKSKKAVFWHYEFCCAEDAARCIARDIEYLPGSARQGWVPGLPSPVCSGAHRS